MAVKIKVTKLDKLNTLVIRQENGKYFLATEDSFIIDISGLAYLLKFLLFNGFISDRMLMGLLEEYNSYSADERYINRKDKHNE
jgi:hypothetical protein